MNNEVYSLQTLLSVKGIRQQYSARIKEEGRTFEFYENDAICAMVEISDEDPLSPSVTISEIYSQNGTETSGFKKYQRILRNVREKASLQSSQEATQA